LLAEQKVGDQVAAQREKDPNPEHPTLRPAQIHVVSNNGSDCNGAKPVKAREVTLATADWLWHYPPLPVRASITSGGATLGRTRHGCISLLPA
jgi:hypothetical protein